MKKQKLYFRSIDNTFCEPLEDILNDAKFEGLSEIKVIEADPDTDTTDHIWCRHYGEVTERSDCSKSVCPHYESKSGRGKCSSKGKLYYHGEEVTFKII
jgi:hypothetical protein